MSRFPKIFPSTSPSALPLSSLASTSSLPPLRIAFPSTSTPSSSSFASSFNHGITTRTIHSSLNTRSPSGISSAARGIGNTNGFVAGAGPGPLGGAGTGSGAGLGNGSGGTGAGAAAGAGAGTNGKGKKKSGHLVWYREIVPAMFPILLISTTLFLSLTLLRSHLSHNLSLSNSQTRIEELEKELERVRMEQKRARVRERRERDRILPLVVERVLQRVGAVGKDEEVEEARLLV